MWHFYVAQEVMFLFLMNRNDSVSVFQSTVKHEVAHNSLIVFFFTNYPQFNRLPAQYKSYSDFVTIKSFPHFAGQLMCSNMTVI